MSNNEVNVSKRSLSLLSSRIKCDVMGQTNTNFLQFIIILPLSAPLWLFTFSSIENFIAQQSPMISIAFLIALSSLFTIIGPTFCCFILRYLHD